MLTMPIISAGCLSLIEVVKTQRCLYLPAYRRG